MVARNFKAVPGVDSQSDLITFDPAGTGAVQRTVESKLQDVVSVLDFIPQTEHAAIKAGTSTYNATTAIQDALDYVINQGNVSLAIPSGTYLISGTLVINKPSGDRSPTYITGGGTLKKLNAGILFDALNPATGEIFFDDIRFLGNAAVNVIAFDCNIELIRCYFSNCYFADFDVCFSSTTNLLQSFRINKCVFTAIKSWVIDCGTSGGFPTGSLFDVSITQSRIEGQTGGVVRGSAGGAFSVSETNIENITGKPAFNFTNAGPASISNNYFENCQQGVIKFETNADCAGVRVQGNYVNLPAGTKFIIWGQTIRGCVSSNNVIGGGVAHDTANVTSGSVATFREIYDNAFANGSAVTEVVTNSDPVRLDFKRDIALKKTYAYGTATSDVAKFEPNLSGGSTLSPTSLGSILWGFDDGTTNIGRINLVANSPGTTLASTLEFWTHSGSLFTKAATLSTNRFLLGTTTEKVSGFTSNFTAAQLSYAGSTTGLGCISDTREVAAVNNSTVDVWVGRKANGAAFTAAMAGHFYIYVRGGSGANAFSGVYSILSTGNGTSDATLAAVSTVTRGTSPVSSVQIANDGVSGALKLTITYINNAGVVDNGISAVSYIGLA
jgi:hypothetical protein